MSQTWADDLACRTRRAPLSVTDCGEPSGSGSAVGCAYASREGRAAPVSADLASGLWHDTTDPWVVGPAAGPLLPGYSTRAPYAASVLPAEAVALAAGAVPPVSGCVEVAGVASAPGTEVALSAPRALILASGEAIIERTWACFDSLCNGPAGLDPTGASGPCDGGGYADEFGADRVPGAAPASSAPAPTPTAAPPAATCPTARDAVERCEAKAVADLAAATLDVAAAGGDASDTASCAFAVGATAAAETACAADPSAEAADVATPYGDGLASLGTAATVAAAATCLEAHKAAVRAALETCLGVVAPVGATCASATGASCAAVVGRGAGLGVLVDAPWGCAVEGESCAVQEAAVERRLQDETTTSTPSETETASPAPVDETTPADAPTDEVTTAAPAASTLCPDLEKALAAAVPVKGEVVCGAAADAVASVALAASDEAETAATTAATTTAAETVAPTDEGTPAETATDAPTLAA